MIGSPGLQSNTAPKWEQAPAEFILRRDEIHVFFASAARSTHAVRALTGLLSHDERLRAEQFYFERDTRRFIVGRSLLRTILAGYLCAQPETLVFSYGAQGKPALAEGWSGALDFNLSHSDEGVLYAVAMGRAVGVDLEYVRALSGMDEIAARVMSESERATFAKASPHARARMFFEFWTRKEAFIKATGDGLSFPVHRIDVALPAGQSTRLLNPSEVGGGPLNWTLFPLAPHDSYSAALIVEGKECAVRCWQWPAA